MHGQLWRDLGTDKAMREWAVSVGGGEWELGVLGRQFEGLLRRTRDGDG